MKPKPTIILKESELKYMPPETFLAMGELAKCVTKYFNKIERHRKRTKNVRIGTYSTPTSVHLKSPPVNKPNHQCRVDA